VVAQRLRWKTAIPITGAALSLLLIVLVDPLEIAISLAVLGVGVVVYMYFSPRKELSEARAVFLSEEAILRRAAAQRTRFLAHPFYHLKMYIYKRRGIEPAIVLVDTDDARREIKE